jgi:mannose-1-phosphate guanylyltransferase/phosphomannomutase
MDAMILAAGAGTRLRPLTFNCPKPLLPVLNRPLLQWILDYLNHYPIKRVILNTHHLADRFETLLPGLHRGGIEETAVRFEPEILNTGGGLINVQDFFRSDPFLVVSGDILTDIDLSSAIAFHQGHGDPITLILHDYPEYNQIEVDSRGLIRRFRKGDGRGLDFANIHILNRSVFDLLPDSGAFDIIWAYQKIIDRGIPVHAYVSRDHYWMNIGTPQSYRKVHEECLTGKGPAFVSQFLNAMMKTDGVLIHPTAVLEEGVCITDWACIGRGCRLRVGSRIERAVLWEGVEVAPGVTVCESIIGNGVEVRENLQKAILC